MLFPVEEVMLYSFAEHLRPRKEMVVELSSSQMEFAWVQGICREQRLQTSLGAILVARNITKPILKVSHSQLMVIATGNDL
jgi:hypothetical protein